MPSSVNTEALRSFLDLDSLNLNRLLESPGISEDDLLRTLFESISNNNTTDESLTNIVQAFYKSVDNGSLSANAAVQTLLATVASQSNGLSELTSGLTQYLSRPTATSAVFSFTNSIFSNGAFSRQYEGRIQPLLREAATIYRSFIPPNAAGFTTVARNGQRLNNGQSNTPSLKWTDRSNGRTNISFAFDRDFSVNGLSFDKAKSLVSSALGVWAQYAPLNFQEVQDPDDGDAVDIYVQSDRIDGRGGTLAFAYFPTFGDITFDNTERWTDTKFLETAVHELGHSLGLGHESDVSAIMNPVLDNKFAGKDAPFLLQDDINGIRYLYGSGRGNVTTLDGNTVSRPTRTPAPVNQTANNLVDNGSFESSPVRANSVGGYKRIRGWTTLSGVGFNVDKRTASIRRAADGDAWVELDAFNSNTTIYQNIDTVTGQDYTLSVDFTANGRNRNSTAVEVFWEGRKVDELTGGGRNQWKSYQFQVSGGRRNVSTLAFRSKGAADNVGGFIDNISVIARADATAEPKGHVCGLSCGSLCMHQHHNHRHPQGHSHGHGHSHTHGHYHGEVANARRLGQFDISRLSAAILDSTVNPSELTASGQTEILPDAVLPT